MIVYYVKKMYNNKFKGEYYIVIMIKDSFIYFDNDFYNYKVGDDEYIWKYFYTPQEVRKMKLEKLFSRDTKQLMK